MSLLGFKKQFAGPVELREKRQTIRAKSQGHKVGRAIQLYTGLRTKACRKLADVDPICTSIAPVVIMDSMPTVIVAGMVLRGDDLVRFAKLDGFDDLAEFFQFFHKPDGTEFAGFLIRWDWP